MIGVPPPMEARGRSSSVECDFPASEAVRLPSPAPLSASDLMPLWPGRSLMIRVPSACRWGRGGGGRDAMKGPVIRVSVSCMRLPPQKLMPASLNHGCGTPNFIGFVGKRRKQKSGVATMVIRGIAFHRSSSRG